MQFTTEQIEAIKNGNKTQHRIPVEIPNYLKNVKLRYDGACVDGGETDGEHYLEEVLGDKYTERYHKIDAPYSVGEVHNVADVSIRITGVMAKMLNDIDNREAKKEGVISLGDGIYKNYGLEYDYFFSPINSFMSLWRSTYGNEDNCLIWVLSFELIKSVPEVVPEEIEVLKECREKLLQMSIGILPNGINATLNKIDLVIQKIENKK